MLSNLISIFYQDLCINCNTVLHKNEEVLCISCRHKTPFISNENYHSNEISNLFYGKFTVNKTISFLCFYKYGITKNLIHHLKYKNRQDVGAFLGNWFGETLKEKKIFNDVDYIISVPLHKTRLRKRGYNQLTTFCKSISNKLSIPYYPDNIKRIDTNTSQTKKNRFDRFEKHKKVFKLVDPLIFENKHVLLIDDVITTGATLQACCSELNTIKNINISIVSIAYTINN